MTTITRRAAFAAPLALAAPLGGLASTGPDGKPDPIFAAFDFWAEAEREHEMAVREADGEETERLLRAAGREGFMALRLANTRPTSPAGLLVQARAMLFMFGEASREAMRNPHAARPEHFHFGSWADRRGRAAARTMFETAEAMARGEIAEPPTVADYRTPKRIGYDAIRERIRIVCETFSERLAAFPDPMPEEDRRALLSLSDDDIEYPGDPLLPLMAKYGVDLDWLFAGSARGFLIGSRVHKHGLPANSMLNEKEADA